MFSVLHTFLIFTVACRSGDQTSICRLEEILLLSRMIEFGAQHLLARAVQYLLILLVGKYSGYFTNTSDYKVHFRLRRNNKRFVIIELCTLIEGQDSIPMWVRNLTVVQHSYSHFFSAAALTMSRYAVYITLREERTERGGS